MARARTTIWLSYSAYIPEKDEYVTWLWNSDIGCEGFGVDIISGWLASGEKRLLGMSSAFARRISL